jgi:uncharacterized repeat protein (TIGR03943 family)
MNFTLQRIFFPLAALSWAVVMLYFYASGRLRFYLAPTFQPICLVGGLLLAVVSLFVLLTYREKADCGHDHTESDAADHETSEMHPLASFLLMVLPLIAAVAWTKDSFSLEALEHKSLYDAPPVVNPYLAQRQPMTKEELEKTYRKNAAGDMQFNLMELYFAIGDPEMIRIIDGMKVETEGRMVAEKVNNPAGTRKRLYRLFITCCAADARAIPIVAEFSQTPPTINENEWVKVTGVIRFPVENGATQAVLEVKSCEKSDPPWEESFMRNQ